MTEAALQKVREFVRDQLAGGAYQLDGEWVRCALHTVEVLGNGSVTASIELPISDRELLITGVRLYDTEDLMWLEQTVNITCKPGEEYMYFNARIRVYAGE